MRGWMSPRAIALVTAASVTWFGGEARAQAVRAEQAVPSDLRPLLQPRRSELRLVVTRYHADRALLATNFPGGDLGGRGGRGGRGGAQQNAGQGEGPAGTPEPAIEISPNRIARLKRFDLSWQTALARLDVAKLSAQARTDLTTLNDSIRSNLRRLDAQTGALSQVMPLLPFAPDLLRLIEDRIAIKEIDAERAAATITAVTKQLADLQAQFASGSLRANPVQARGAANALEQIRVSLADWNRFFDGYDPLYSWWMRMPYRKVDAALQAYAALLREKVAPENQTSSLRVVALEIAPAAAPKYNEVPDLQEIIALSQDEMTAIVRRFQSAEGGRGGRGNAPPVQRDAAYYNAWLAALKPLDFDRLSRNAQVDYLYLKKRAELEVARAGKPLPPAASTPRKQDSSGIPGPARGREGLIRDLQDALIPYTPEQLIVLAEREFAWHEAEMKKNAQQMGFGDDWKKALEATKAMHPPPGGQPYMIRDLLLEAVDYLRQHDLVTVPQVEAESQHMIMMTPERQLVNPFFTGGGQMSVSFPTDGMEFDARQQSMRGNNRPWSHATAFHEMIPGHNMTGYYGQRFADYRPSWGGGPFFGEGWAVYWELTLWELGFHDTPEERIGALFWRMHRCARIIFSLKFHMGQWSPQEAIDFLVDRVGHERDNATAEVRRSFDPAAGYGALYQAGYLLGALQLRSLRKDIVDSGKMTNKAFHDEILRLGSHPINLLRLTLNGQKLSRDMSIDWPFYGELPER